MCRLSPRPRLRSCITLSTSIAASFSASMSRLRAHRRRMVQSQTLEALYDAAASRAATMPVPPCSPTSRRGASRHSSSSCIGEASCGTTRWLSAATAFDGLGEVGGVASCLTRNYRARRATQTALCRRTVLPARRMPPKEWTKWWKEELGRRPAPERTCVAGVGFSHSTRVSISIYILLYSVPILSRTKNINHNR